MGLNRQLANLPDAITTDTSNNVGIGGSPSGTYKFEVTGTAKISSTLLVSGAATLSGTETTLNFNPQTNLLSGYYYLNFGGGSIMYRNTTDIYIGSNSKYGSAGTTVANYTSANGMGMLTMDGGQLNYQANATSVTAGTVYSMPIRFSITGAGNVGIGTSSPQAQLDITGFNGNLRLYSANGVTNNSISSNMYWNGSTFLRDVSAGCASMVLHPTAGIIFNTTASTTGGPDERMRITAAGDMYLQGRSTNGDYGMYFYSNDTDSRIYSSNSGAVSKPLQFYTAGTERMRITSGGLVGIGITSPSGLLSLKAEPTNTPTLVFQNSLGGPNSAISNFTSSVQTFTIIGTNYYVNSSANGARFNTSYAGCGIIFDEGILRFATSTTSTNPSTRMTITADGALQVSKNTLNDSVQMFSNVSFGSGTTGQITINQSNSWYVEKQSDGYYWVMYGMDSAGLGWKWNTYSGSYANRFFFHANGTAYNSTGTWGNSSDIRLKQDIVDANPQWDDIKALKFKKYRLKKDVQAESESTDGYVAPVHFGLIAQEVELTSPGLIEDVIEGDSTTKMIKTSIMLMKSVKALQEAMIKIEELNDRINKLENK